MSARDLGLLALRVGVGGTLVAHGGQNPICSNMAAG